MHAVKWWNYVSRSHMDPFRTRDLCLQMGGGSAPPQSPPLSFYAAQACFQKHRTINTTCFTSIIVLELFKPITLAVHLQTRGLRPPNPRTSLSCTRPLQVSSCQQKQNPYMAPFRTRDKDAVCAPNPGASKKQKPYGPSPPRMQAVYLQIGGLRLPQPPRLDKLCKKTSSIILPAKNRTHMDRLRTRDKDFVFANWGGGGAAPPNPPAFFSRRAGLQEHRTMNKNWFKHIEVI